MESPRPTSPPVPKSNQRKKPRPKKNCAWLKEMRKLQQSTDLLMAKLPFSRLVREIMQQEARSSDLKVTREALMAIQESAELYLTFFFQDANRIAVHAKRVTLMPKDMQLIFQLRNNWGQRL